MSGWTTPQSLAALALTAIFVGIVVTRRQRGVLAYAVLGATPPALQIASFSGRTVSQGLLLAEVLATVLVGTWLLGRERGRRWLRTPFDAPLLLMAASAILSLVAAELAPEARMAGQVTRAVSVGQVLLVLWPVGVYFASRELITRVEQLRWLQRVTLLLALPQLVMPWVPNDLQRYMAWTWTFGLYASPLALAAIFATRSWLTRLLYCGIVLIPLVRGVTSGKVFLYGFVVSAAVAILWVRARGASLVAALMLAVLLVAGALAAGSTSITSPFERLVDTERQQSSFEGKGGRGALIVAALSIWQEAPLLGVGPGNSYVYMLERSPIGTPHNQYMNILTEFGLVGLGIWLWFLAATFRTGLRVYHALVDPELRTYALGWIGVFAGMVAGSVTGDYMLHSIRNGGLELFQGYYPQWILLGGLVAAVDLQSVAARDQLAPDDAAPMQRGRALAVRRGAGRFGARQPAARLTRR